MTLRLELNPEVEANLVAQAEARGVPLDAYLQRVIEDLGRSRPSPSTSLNDMRRTLDMLADMGRGLVQLPPSAFTRESIYRDHD